MKCNITDLVIFPLLEKKCLHIALCIENGLPRSYLSRPFNKSIYVVNLIIICTHGACLKETS